MRLWFGFSTDLFNDYNMRISDINLLVKFAEIKRFMCRHYNVLCEKGFITC